MVKRSTSFDKEKILKTIWKLGVITAIAFFAFLLEMLLPNIFGGFIRPNFLLILIIFINLYSGVRYALYVAFLGGILSDGAGVGPFGVSLCALVLCAYVATLTKKYLFYEIEFGFLRNLITVFVVLFYAVIMTFLTSNILIEESRWRVFSSFIPQVVLTSIIAPWVYKVLKTCALKLSV